MANRNKEIVSMIRLFSYRVIVASAVLLGACSSSPPVKYYGLQATESVYAVDPDNAPILAIGPLRVPDYLKRTQMVSRGRGTERIVDDFNRWAEPLDSAMHATIASNVDSLLDSVIVVAFPFSPVIEYKYRMVGRVDRFDTDANGLAVLDVQWSLGDSNGNFLGDARRSRYTVQAASHEPAARAQAMSEALAQFSQDIATEMQKVLP